VGLVQRSKGNQFLERRHHAAVDDHRLRILQASVNDPMPDAHQVVRRELGA
jgi:hypothetical protein